LNLSLLDLQREAAATGFHAETLEKSIRIVRLLNALRSHPFLKTRIALKGGTALNLFIFDVPRLSVDIDLNYLGPSDRDVMLAERPKLEQALQAVCGREGLTARSLPSDHAGGKWRLTYTAASGRSGNLELDVNFLFRTPLWTAELADSRSVSSFQATQMRLLDIHELAAGKLAALLSRNASRDVFDAVELLRREDLDRAKLRLGFVVYGGANRKDWRTVSAKDVKPDAAELKSQLLPMVRPGALPKGKARALVSDCRDLLSAVLPLTRDEREFIERLNESGEIAAELLTDAAAMRKTIQEHPALRWKAMNVRKHRGLPPTEQTE
jgi:predicted nucleotidyltransferase component of viral defense system